MTSEKEILDRALLLLQQKGTDAMPEDKLPQLIGISPEEFKDIFGSKEEMISKLMTFDLKEQDKANEEIISNSGNSIEALLNLIQVGIERLKRINPVVIGQIQQQYPEAWQLYQNHNETYSYYQVYDLINKGILDQDFRKDINIELVTKIILAQSGILFNPAMFPPDRYNLAEVFRSIYLYYIRGICTDKGAKTSEDYFSSLKV
ncbi:MAG: TetR/AcrR family transcriptional regulator [Hymenobacteraceae bacterium]|nr:TetR/AcrR family transcriptional regulator [Hymenobacteraceae bacterium]MDX5395975.1 TetR/AcrR family transcriptional regulator [Hymenobacteraceae bacterium]MDX5443827.1 TetR/AcrR family transcriptional regulator [Hymenobacteraceae bacterium]MDX5512036.1 TetR/AcrR family transcriptional regulator [Hymenobacteraceae bacterium]